MTERVVFTAESVTAGGPHKVVGILAEDLENVEDILADRRQALQQLKA
jgi:hypothetical protein